MTISRLRVGWSDSGVVGPGLTTFYFANGPAQVAPVLTLFTAIAANDLPDDVTITVPNTGDDIDEATGNIVGTWTASGGGQVIGGNSGSFALGTGCRMRWETGGIVGGRHVRGTTFLVPLAAASFASDGRVGATALTRLRNAQNAFVAAVTPDLVVWSRPRPGRLGSIHAVTSGVVPDLPTQLRSRRT